MDAATKKKIIIIAVINLFLAILLVKFKLIFSFGIYFKELTYIALIGCGIINYFFLIEFIKKNGVREHIKFFIPFSVIVALFFKLVYILYRIVLESFYHLYYKTYFDVSGISILLKSFFSGIVGFAFIFFIGTIMGSALKDIKDKQVRKKITIRLIVYPIVILSAFFLYRFVWVNYTGEYVENSKIWHTIKLKLRGVEFCETPEEVIQRYADALIRGDRRKALGYVYKPKYDTKGWEGDKRRLYSRTNEELKKEGEKMIKDGYLEEKSGSDAEWAVIYNIDGIESRPTERLIYTTYDGWKIY